MDILTFIMLLCGGLFAGGVLTVAWDRLPAWKKLTVPAFKSDFKQTVHVADILQPGLLAVAILSTLIFGMSGDGEVAGLAFAATLAYIVVMALSLAILVPLQRKILSSPDRSEEMGSMRRRWATGHVGRTVLSVIAFGLAVSAAAIQA